MAPMAGSWRQRASRGDVDHGFGDAEALVVLAPQASPAGEPGKGSFADPALQRDPEARRGVDAADDRDRGRGRAIAIVRFEGNGRYGTLVR